MVQICVEATSEAAPEAVWKLLIDGASWPCWSPLGSFELEREGRDGGESVGAIRVFRSHISGRNYVAREQLVEVTPTRRLSYVLLSGLAVRDYRADIELAECPGGTTIRWHSTFRPKLPGTGWLYRGTLTRMIRQIVDGMAAAAA